jgi:hypothetical protein
MPSKKLRQMSETPHFDAGMVRRYGFRWPRSNAARKGMCYEKTLFIRVEIRSIVALPVSGC